GPRPGPRSTAGPASTSPGAPSSSPPGSVGGPTWWARPRSVGGGWATTCSDGREPGLARPRGPGRRPPAPAVGRRRPPDAAPGPARLVAAVAAGTRPRPLVP